MLSGKTLAYKIKNQIQFSSEEEKYFKRFITNTLNKTPSSITYDEQIQVNGYESAFKRDVLAPVIEILFLKFPQFPESHKIIQKEKTFIIQGDVEYYKQFGVTKRRKTYQIEFTPQYLNKELPILREKYAKLIAQNNNLNGYEIAAIVIGICLPTLIASIFLIPFIALPLIAAVGTFGAISIAATSGIAIGLVACTPLALAGSIDRTDLENELTGKLNKPTIQNTADKSQVLG